MGWLFERPWGAPISVRRSAYDAPFIFDAGWHDLCDFLLLLFGSYLQFNGLHQSALVEFLANLTDDGAMEIATTPPAAPITSGASKIARRSAQLMPLVGITSTGEVEAK